jgi:hypothetical protein
VQALDYYEQVLEPIVTPAFQGLLSYKGYLAQSTEGGDWGLYVEDQASVHGTRKVLVEAKRLLAIPLHSRPATSPDLNPIENVWRTMKQRIKVRARFPSTLAGSSPRRMGQTTAS